MEVVRFGSSADRFVEGDQVLAELREGGKVVTDGGGDGCGVLEGGRVGDGVEDHGAVVLSQSTRPEVRVCSARGGGPGMGELESMEGVGSRLVSAGRVI